MPFTAPDPEDIANASFNALTGDVDFNVELGNVSGTSYQVPATTGPLYATVDRVENIHLTETTLAGNGTFDVLMRALKTHLEGEYKSNRITGAEYTKAYIALTEGAMSNAVQFLMGRESAYWQAISAQVQAQVAQVQLVTARVQLETAKAQLQQTAMEMNGAKATFALTKMKLANEAAAHGIASFNLQEILPQQLTLLTEQTEAARAQTMDTRSDGETDVTGTLGKQKELYGQQITSYQRDAETKVAKLFTDAWITQKTIDEGLLAPTGFTNASLDTILSALKVNNGFV